MEGLRKEIVCKHLLEIIIGKNLNQQENCLLFRDKSYVAYIEVLVN